MKLRASRWKGRLIIFNSCTHQLPKLSSQIKSSCRFVFYKQLTGTSFAKVAADATDNKITLDGTSGQDGTTCQLSAWHQFSDEEFILKRWSYLCTNPRNAYANPDHPTHHPSQFSPKKDIKRHPWGYWSIKTLSQETKAWTTSMNRHFWSQEFQKPTSVLLFS